MGAGELSKSMKSLFGGFEKIVREAEPFAPHTWFQLGGPAEFFAEPNSVEELAALVRRCHDAGVPIRLLGGGSNLLVRDDGVEGLVVRLSAARVFRNQRASPHRHRRRRRQAWAYRLDGRRARAGRLGNAGRHSRHRRRRPAWQRRQPRRRRRPMDLPGHRDDPLRRNSCSANAKTSSSPTAKAASMNWRFSLASSSWKKTIRKN